MLAAATPLFFATSLLAQDPVEPSVIEDLFDYDHAGLIGYLIILMSVMALALIIENFVTIKREKLAPPNLLDELEELFEAENWKDAIVLCERDKNYLTSVVGAGLSKLGHSFETMQASLREMQTEETAKLFQRIGWLLLIAAMSAMTGLFGTVTRMFLTFGTIARAGDPVSPAALASGIKMALITTIFGLAVAIPVSLAFYALRYRVLRTSREINALTEDLFERFRSASPRS
jgi:biopolymer transport protein ExbB